MESKLSNFLFQATGVGRVRQFLDLASLRHKLISGNVANVSTPGYRSQDIDFKAELAKSSQKSSGISGSVTHQSHIPLGQHSGRLPEIHRAKVARGDLNSVDIDHEVPKMAQNELEFTIGARLLKMKFDGLRKAISSR
jgi:flagellar basal-body rod protein FlgB